MENRNEHSIVRPNWEITLSFMAFIFLVIFLFIGLVSCNKVDLTTSTTKYLTLEPSRTNTMPTSPPASVLTSTFTPISQKTQPPKFTSTSTPFRTATPKITGWLDNLAPGEYLILDEGALALNTKTLIPLADDIPGGRLSSDGKRTITIRRGLKQSDDLYYHVTNLVTGDQINIPLLDNCDAAYSYWSPDGKMIMTSCFSNYQIIIQSFPDGKEVSRVSFADPDNTDVYSIDHALWSLDGNWVAYIEFNHSTKPGRWDQIFFVSSECFYHSPLCKETKRIAAKIERHGWNLIDWASQDRLIILEQAKHRFIIYDVNHSKVVRIIPLPSRFNIPKFAVSPDGNQIFFGQLTADEKGSAIYRASLEDGKIERLYYGEGLREIIVYYFIEK